MTAFSRGSADEMLAAELLELIEQRAVVGAELAEIGRDQGTVALGHAGDDGVLGAEVAIEIARAHARLGRDVLHRRRMEPGAREDALRRVEDADMALRQGGIGLRRGNQRWHRNSGK